MQVKKQQVEPDTEQRAGSKLGKEYVKAVYCHPAYLTYTQSTSCEMPGWMNHKLESKFPGEISTTSDMQMIPLLTADSEGQGKLVCAALHAVRVRQDLATERPAGGGA